MDKPPLADLKFDGYVRAADGPSVPCDVVICLPRGPAEDAYISVFLNGPAEAVIGHGGVQITSNEEVESLGLKFLAEDVLIRSGNTQPGFRAGGSQLTITHVGRWVIHRIRMRAESSEDSLQHVCVSLSDLGYGSQASSSTVSYLGTREVHTYEPARRLRFSRARAPWLTWELQKHWDWKSDKTDDSLSAYATPVLSMTDSPPMSVADLPQVKQCAEDTCVLLTLAARHRTAAHVISYSTEAGWIQDWRYPLARIRSQTEEEASGPLIAKDEFEAFFEQASGWWSMLEADHKDAVRLAVFALHGSTSQTLESDLMSRFSALEGLAKRWGAGETAAGAFRDMLSRYPADVGGLWPMYEKTNGVPLYWLRNEIAHGRTALRSGAGLSLASDHLQHWVERILLALIGYRRVDRSDWLSRQIFQEQDEIARVRAALAASTSRA